MPFSGTSYLNAYFYILESQCISQRRRDCLLFVGHIQTPRNCRMAPYNFCDRWLIILCHIPLPRAGRSSATFRRNLHLFCSVLIVRKASHLDQTSAMSQPLSHPLNHMEWVKSSHEIPLKFWSGCVAPEYSLTPNKHMWNIWSDLSSKRQYAWLCGQCLIVFRSLASFPPWLYSLSPLPLFLPPLFLSLPPHYIYIYIYHICVYMLYMCICVYKVGMSCVWSLGTPQGTCV